MPSTTNPLPDLNEPVVDRFRRWTPIWYRWIKPLLETVKRTTELADNTQQELTELTTTVGENTTTITEVIESVEGVAANWGIVINQNGAVTGAIKLDSTQNFSQFKVLANKFIIEHPTSTGTTVEAFVATTVDGNPAVGINGDLLVAGTVDATALAVDTLSSIAADIGTVTAGVLQSADGNFVIDLNNKYIVITT